MLSINLSSVSAPILGRYYCSAISISSIVLILCLRAEILSFSCFQRFSIGERSGDWAANLISGTLWGVLIRRGDRSKVVFGLTLLYDYLVVSRREVLVRKAYLQIKGRIRTFGRYSQCEVGGVPKLGAKNRAWTFYT
jgi:hypothetical protein